MAHGSSIKLDKRSVRFADEQVASGRYGSVSEVIQAGLQLLKEREDYLDSIEQALIEGEQSGPAEPLDMDEIIRKAKASVNSARAA